DTRRSSYMLEFALVTGMVSTGADVYMMHVTTTPSVAYITRTEGFDAGVMITASHNPFYDNGIKLLDRNGGKLDEDTISKIEGYIDGGFDAFGKHYEEIPSARREEIGRAISYVEGRNRYIGYLISLGVYSFRGMKVGIDCANGAAWSIAPSVFEALGAKVYIINNEPNGININHDAGSTHIEGLQKFVVENGLDVGFAYDGDADRCLAVDEKGNVVNGDLIMYIYARYMKERGKLLGNTVVTTVMSNFGLFKAFDELGIGYVKTKVGDKYVHEYMVEHGCRIGGEQSGHIIFSKYATTGDGILTSLKVMQVMMDRKKTLSELASPVTVYPQTLINVRVGDKEKTLSDPLVKAKVQEVKCRLAEKNEGAVLVRESGTEPVIRVMVEAAAPETADAYANEIADVIREQGAE
ncbi:MAG: phosphoglucosamine mutase, partial [Eubacteriales bacterium]|nr:phosphoglucosamine mutase [Eubacteriales bacterium]